MSLELKVKALSLSAEAKIIRRIEHRCRKAWRRNRANDKARDQFWSMRNHRTGIVRDAARTTHLARMFLKDVPYGAAERLCYDLPDFGEVFKLGKRYGGPDERETAQRFERWKQAATEHLKTTFRTPEAIPVLLTPQPAQAPTEPKPKRVGLMSRIFKTS